MKASLIGEGKGQGAKRVQRVLAGVEGSESKGRGWTQSW